MHLGALRQADVYTYHRNAPFNSATQPSIIPLSTEAKACVFVSAVALCTESHIDITPEIFLLSLERIKKPADRDNTSNMPKEAPRDETPDCFYKERSLVFI